MKAIFLELELDKGSDRRDQKGDRIGQMEKDRIGSGNLEGSNHRTEQRMGTILPNRTDKGWSTDPGKD